MFPNRTLDSEPLKAFLKWAALALGGLILVVGVAGYVMFRPHVEEIPEELPDMEADPSSIVLPAQADLPEVAVGELEGKTVYFVVFSRESAEAGEGKKLQRALDRWVYPDDVQGYGIGHVKGYGAFSGMIDEMMAAFRAEARLPMYADYEGVVMDTFQMPAGHFAMVVLGPDGEVKLRHSGDADEAKIEEIRQALGAEPPPPPAPAPTFSVGELDNERCAEAGCILVFLDRKVSAEDVPGLLDDEGRPSMRKQREAMKKLQQPSVRLVHRVVAYWKLDGSIPGALVGETDGIAMKNFELVDEAPELREAFDVGANEAAMVVIDADGGLAFKETGFVPMYKFSLVRDMVDLPKRDDGDDDDGAS